MTNEYVFYEIFEECSKEPFPGTYVFPYESTGYRFLSSNSYAYRSAAGSKNKEVRERVRKYEISCTSEPIEVIVSNNLKMLLRDEKGRSDDVMKSLVSFLRIGGTASDDNLALLRNLAVEQATTCITEKSDSLAIQFG